MRRERVFATSSSALAAVLAVALVFMLNWLGYRHYQRGDWTKAKLYSLSEKSRNVLKSLTGEIKVVVFMTPSTPLFRETKELLTNYAAASPKIKVEYIDPERDPLRTRTLAQQFGVSAANTVVFSSGDRKKYVTSDQLADYDYSGMQFGQGPKLKAYKGEEQFTAAVMGVESAKVPKVCFTTGHGERDIDGVNGDGLSQFRDALKRDNLDAEKVSLLSGKVPDDCDLLVIAGPTAPFAEAEKAALKAYLEKGGRVLVMLDPVLGGHAQEAGLTDLLKGYGVQVDNDVVLDPSRQLPFLGPEALYVSDFRSHPTTEGLQNMAVLLPVARSVNTVTAQGVTSTVLLTTSAGGWGETDLPRLLATHQAEKDAEDVAGPVPLGVAAQPEKDKEKGWRLVVLGNSVFLANAELANAGNLNLGLNAVNWLARREEALGLAPRQAEQVQLFLSASQMRSIALISLFGLPACAVALGVVVWWRRRR